MKNLMKLSTKIFTLVVCSSMLMLTACSKEDVQGLDENQVLKEASLTASVAPTAIQDYVATHFPSSTILSVVKDTDGNMVEYEVRLSGNVELEFNSVYAITEIDAKSQLPDSVIPQAIIDYVAQNYPNHFITDWELLANRQQVQLNDGTELDFEMNGDFISSDSDSDNDNDSESDNDNDSDDDSDSDDDNDSDDDSDDDDDDSDDDDSDDDDDDND